MARNRILIADDEKDLVEILKLRFEHEGYEIVTAFDGREALDQVEATHPDIILLDIMMPKMNGFQVCETLKKDAKTKSIPIIFFTAKAQEVNRLQGLALKADAYVTKPCEMAILLKEVQKLLVKK